MFSRSWIRSFARVLDWDLAICGFRLLNMSSPITLRLLIEHLILIQHYFFLMNNVSSMLKKSLEVWLVNFCCIDEYSQFEGKNIILPYFGLLQTVGREKLVHDTQLTTNLYVMYAFINLAMWCPHVIEQGFKVDKWTLVAWAPVRWLIAISRWFPRLIEPNRLLVV